MFGKLNRPAGKFIFLKKRVFINMTLIYFIKKTFRWLWPSLVIIFFSCVRKSVFESLTFEQIQDGLLLYAGYLFCIVPIGSLLLRTKWFADESKIALLILFVTYVFFEYAIVFSTWERFAGYWVEQFLFNKQHTVFIIVLVACGIGLLRVLRSLNDKQKNWGLFIFTTLVLAIGPFVEYLFKPSYEFDSDLFDIKQSDITVNNAEIPQRIFWIILDEHPSSLILNQAWGYKDTTFRRGLESLGFTVYDSCVSNYNYTPFSIAATTYGAMLPIRKQQVLDVKQWFSMSERIRQSPVITFFRMQGYEIRNLTFFDSSHGDLIKFLKVPNDVVASSILGMLLLKLNRHTSMPETDYNNKILDNLCNIMIPNSKNSEPIFVYAHILMPHYPYLPLEVNWAKRDNPFLDPANEQAFLHHIRYTDSTIINLFQKVLDTLTPDQRSNTLLILQADHGYRYLRKGINDLRLKSSFGILNAVLWPNNNLKGRFYNGMSSVNTFRILFRDLWGINLNTLKDSSENVNPYFRTD
jgi:hypothetical protein